MLTIHRFAANGYRVENPIINLDVFCIFNGLLTISERMDLVLETIIRR